MTSPLLCVAIPVPAPLGPQLDAVRRELIPTRRHMVAHITLISPFRTDEPERWTTILQGVAEASRPFEVSLRGTGTFGDPPLAVYLALERGVEECQGLYEALAANESPRPEPYWLVPHVTLANRCPAETIAATIERFDGFEADFTADEVVCFQHAGEGWRPIARATLGQSSRGPAPAVVAALDGAGLDYRVIVHDEPVHSLAEAAGARGVDVVDVIKTLVVRRGDDDYLLVLVPGGRSLSWPKLRSLLGVSRLSMPPADEAFAATGFKRGTITPLGALGPWPVVADAIVATRGEVTLGSGAHDVAVGVDAAALIAAVGAQVADVTDPE